MATGLEKRNAESIARARLNERQETPKKKAPQLSDGITGTIPAAVDRAQKQLAKSRAEEQVEMAKSDEDYSWLRKTASNIAIIPGASC